MIDDDDRTLSTRSGSEPSRPCPVQSHKQNKIITITLHTHTHVIVDDIDIVTYVDFYLFFLFV